MRRTFYSISLFISLFIASTFAKTPVWTVNKAHSQINFSVSYLKLAEVTGRFEQFQGELEFDPNNFKKIKKLELKIQTQSIDTNNKIRDNHLRSSDFFNVAKFPRITFKATEIAELSNNTYQAKGVLTLKNRSKEVSVQFKMDNLGRDLWGNPNHYLSFVFQLERTQWGLDWNKSLKNNQLLVGKTVIIKGNFQLQPPKQQTIGQRHMIPDNNYMRLKNKVNRGEIKQEVFDRKLEEFDRQTRDLVEQNSHQTAKNITPKKTNQPHSQTSGEYKDDWWMVSFAFLGFFALIGVFIGGQNLTQYLSTKTKNGQNIGNGLMVIWFILYSLTLSHLLGQFY